MKDNDTDAIAPLAKVALSVRAIFNDRETETEVSPAEMILAVAYGGALTKNIYKPK